MRHVNNVLNTILLQVVCFDNDNQDHLIVFNLIERSCSLAAIS